MSQHENSRNTLSLSKRVSRILFNFLVRGFEACDVEEMISDWSLSAMLFSIKFYFSNLVGWYVQYTYIRVQIFKSIFSISFEKKMWFCFKYHQWRIQAQGLAVIFSHHQVCVKRRREDTFFAVQIESRISAPLFASKTV